MCNSTIVLQNKSSLHNWLLQPLTCHHASRREKCEFLQIINPKINCFNLKVRLRYLLASSDILTIFVKSHVSINMLENCFLFLKFLNLNFISACIKLVFTFRCHYFIGIVSKPLALVFISDIKYDYEVLI